MTDQEKLDALTAWNNILADTLLPLLAGEGAAGLVAVRVFYSVRQKDGVMSGGNLGLTADPVEGEALKGAILRLLLVAGDQKTAGVVEQPRRC